MQIVDTGAAGSTEPRFGSSGLTVIPLARDAANVVVLRVDAGGRVGRHPAVGHQLFTVVVGRALVSGADGVEQPLGPGQAVVWAPGEQHETRTETGFTAVVCEGGDLVVGRG